MRKHFDAKVCKIIDKGMDDYVKQFCQGNNYDIAMAEAIYKDTYANLIFNFNSDNETVKRIKKDIDENQQTAYNLAFLDPSELNEEMWRRINERKTKTDEIMSNLPTVPWKKCRCNSNAYFYWQEQTRGADEPMTTFYQCKGCRKVYKVNN
jgi:DNA-directed RNA polymerase subunit M/transcription elongation factor TFIIS